MTENERREVIEAVEILLDEADGDPEGAKAIAREDAKDGFPEDIISWFCKAIDYVSKKRSTAHAK